MQVAFLFVCVFETRNGTSATYTRDGSFTKYHLSFNYVCSLNAYDSYSNVTVQFIWKMKKRKVKTQITIMVEQRIFFVG